MVALDHGRRVACNRHGLDHIGIKRALREKLGSPGAFGGLVKDFDEGASNDLALAFGVSHAFEALEEKARGILILQLNAEMAFEHLTHHIGFTSAQHAVVDENAGELVADRFVQQRGGDTGIDSAAQAQDDTFITHLLADLRHRNVDIALHRPVLAAAANVMDEIAEHLFAARGVGHLRMKLEPEHLAGMVFDCGVR
ncbi:hypothetical protein SDC9_168469 [bioreactor metagenome]|uniref:Uncharacterized protein n=1 Tax=bioreactor metagenome TaxID=1076179 RepID=A0A645G587_9ZZZZ